MSRSKQQYKTALRPKLIALSVAACFSVSATQSLANPTGGTVVSGSASFNSAGNTLTVANTANTIINWQGFSIGVNEITRFLQSSAASAVLNRVVGANGVIPQSVIDGVLASNGRVFLLNTSGVVIGSTARIDVGGLVASSLNLSNDDFLNGRLHFTEVAGAGKVSNAGVIDTSSSGAGGRVFLVAPDVENTGTIISPHGEIVLAAGKSVDLVSEGSPFVTVHVTADNEQALNLGRLIADSGRIGMFGALVRQGGVAEANSALVGENGEIRLVATNSVTLDAGSVTSASGGTQGGNIEVSAPVVVQAGDIRADGNTGGRIQIDATNFLQAGTLSASGSAGAGGEIGVNAAHVIQTSAATIAADGSGGDGGSISVDASSTLDGLLFSSAKYSATGDRGGNIKLLGHDIVLLGASADASGANGGGTILVGGDFHGNNPAVPNAVTTGINFSTTLKADATQNGDGGKVVVWSDTRTQFYGTASARGGAQSGNGGFMEISGRENLTMGGFADAGAPNGTPGTLLLDPKNIIIDSNVGSGTLSSFQLVDPHPGASEQFGTQVVVLSNQNVVVTDPNDSFGAIGAGAVYLFNSSTGGLISALTGSTLNDHVGSGTITTLPSGNYLVPSLGWNNAAATLAGAVTFGSGTNGISGVVSAANSLVGTTANDQIGSNGVLLLNNGNYVVKSPNWSNGTAAFAGAVTWGSGATGVSGAVSATNSLVGTTTADSVGSSVTELTNGHYVVSEISWQNSGATRSGAVTWVNGTNGNIAGSASPGGAVSASNSLVGSAAFDDVGTSITVLTNGNYVMSTPSWNNNSGPTAHFGAATWVNGANGNIAGTASPGGAVSSANSLVGSSLNDSVGHSVTALGNGNYVVENGLWHNGSAQVGAVTWVNGSNGNFGGGTTPGGFVTTSNSLVGSQAGDTVGFSLFGPPGIVPLSNSNYLVLSSNWQLPGAAPIILVGAVTLVNGLTGNIGGTGTPGGTVSASNSLVGSAARDGVGSGGVVQLANGNYVVLSPGWNKGGGTVGGMGAVTFGTPTSAVTGVVSSANSLVGSSVTDSVGSFGVRTLSNGNYVVLSPSWNNGAATAAGAVTFGNGTTGVTGAVSATNSLVGTTTSDAVGSFGIMPLFTNGNYVVISPSWNNGTTAAAVGAVTWVNGTNGNIAGTTSPGGAVSASNSLVGTTANDSVGSGFVIPLFSNGNYVVISPNWNNGPATSAGAVTWVNGTNGNIAGSTSPGGAVSASNSLVGTTANDKVGSSGIFPIFDVNLLIGNYVVISPNWNNGASGAAAGAVTWVNGANGNIAGSASPGGIVSASNSLVGTTANDQVGSGGVTPLIISGNYVVSSPNWNNSATGATRVGAVTWVNGTNGNVFGQASPGAVVSASNSLVGSTLNDQVGLSFCDCSQFHGIAELPNGNFVVVNPDWTNPGSTAGRAGAVTFGNGTAGIAGLVSSTNSLIGSSANDQFGSGGISPLLNGAFVVSSPNAANGALASAGLVHVVTSSAGSTLPATGETFASTPGGDVTITPAAITAITNTGTAVVLQANNDITLNPGSNIVTSAGGAGGSLTLQAGRSILLNSNITTDNGAVTIVANERTTNGVVDANRDAGAAVITQAAGTTINAGSANISLTLSDGAGLTNSTSGDITLAGLTTTGHVLVHNVGPTAGSGIVRADANQLITAGSAALDVNGVGGGGKIGTPAAPIRVSLANLAARTQVGGAFFDSPTQGLTIGGATLGGLTGISASGAGSIQVSAAGAVSVTEALSTGSGAVKLAAGGALSESAAGLVSTTGTLTTSSAGGATLNGANAVGAFNATNTTSGNIAFTDAATVLTVTGISEGGGSVTLSNTGAVNLGGTVSAGAGNVTLVSGGDISSSVSSGYAAQGGAVVLTAASGAIGSPSGLIAVNTATLQATAAKGIAIDVTATTLAPVTINTLQNTATGDIILNAHGGADIVNLVSNPGGSVTINTFSPLTVEKGISAGNSIFLSTGAGSSSNDMSLNGPFTHNTSSGAFEVTIGVDGTLLLVASGQTLTAPPLSNPLNITKFTFITPSAADPLSNPEVAQNFGSATNSTTQSTTNNTQQNTVTTDDQKKKDKEENKKGAAVCK